MICGQHFSRWCFMADYNVNVMSADALLNTPALTHLQNPNLNSLFMSFAIVEDWLAGWLANNLTGWMNRMNV